MSYETNVVMCPSYKATYDRIHSPKGRAVLLKEWLRQITQKTKQEKEQLKSHEIKVQESIAKKQKLQEQTPISSQIDSASDKWYRFLRFITPRSWVLFSKVQQLDFSHQVYRSMQGCLGCKACATSCPVKVNIPHMRSKFLHQYHNRFGRSWQDILISRFEIMSAFRKRTPRLSKIAFENKFAGWFLERFVGLANLPKVRTEYCRKAVPLGRGSKNNYKNGAN